MMILSAAVAVVTRRFQVARESGLFDELDDTLDVHVMVANNLSRLLEERGHSPGVGPLKHPDIRPY